MVRTRREGNYTLPKKTQKTNSIEDLMGNEENRYPVPDPNKTMINITNEPSNTHKISLRGNHGRGYEKHNSG
jgi:hypothetical protein